MPQQPQSFNPTSEVELPGLNSSFVSLQEFGSHLDWQEAMADAWGIPHPTQPSDSRFLSRLAALPQKLVTLSTTAIRAASSSGVS